MKLSNGTSITYGSDSLGYAILVDGEFEGNVLSKSPDWTIDEQTGNLKDSRRCWRIGPGRTLERTTNQCPNDFFVFLKEQIEKLPQNGLHPSLIYGFEAEAERLFPKISEEAKAQFKSFISTLKATHKIKEKEERSKVLANFVDDVGPTLLVVVDQKPVVLPEIPKVYKAPTDWFLAMWRINNHMIGPLILDDISDEDKIQFVGLSIPAEELTEKQKGIYYFHMARFVLFFEAWVGNPNAPYLLEFIRLYQSGFRFLDKVLV